MTNNDYSGELDALLDAPKAEAFRATRKGDRIDGVVTGPIREWEGEFGLYPIVTLRTTKIIEDGQEKSPGEVRSVHGLGILLAEKLREEDPRRGDVLAVRFNGEVESPKTGRSYKDWSVACIRDSAPAPLRPTRPSPRPTEEEPF